MLLELARLYLLQGHLDLCEQHCADLLQTEKSHEMASVVWGHRTSPPPALPRVPTTARGLLPGPITPMLG